VRPPRRGPPNIYTECRRGGEPDEGRSAENIRRFFFIIVVGIVPAPQFDKNNRLTAISTCVTVLW